MIPLNEYFQNVLNNGNLNHFAWKLKIHSSPSISILVSRNFATFCVVLFLWIRVDDATVYFTLKKQHLMVLVINPLQLVPAVTGVLTYFTLTPGYLLFPMPHDFTHLGKPPFGNVPGLLAGALVIAGFPLTSKIICYYIIICRLNYCINSVHK